MSLSTFFQILLSYSCIFHCSLGLADHAAYFIRNAQDNLCITAGPIISGAKMAVFKKGIPISANCTNGHDQEWVIREKNTTLSINAYELRSLSSQNFDRQLNAQLRGEFIIYFPNRVQFRPIGKYFGIYDTRNKRCLESHGDNHVLHEGDCNFRTNLAQQWIFNLANQAKAAGTICSSFWLCNQ